MSSRTAPSNKAKIARRVIEVLEYFDESRREATVMDIVRRFNRPQSSTSELLSSLVELGLLYKDPYSRSYRLTPRAALLGSAGQPELVRDGRLTRLIDRLIAQTGLPVGLFGMVGMDAQILSWQSGHRPRSAFAEDVFGGIKVPLCETAAGWALLSAIESKRREGMVRRLNAEASEARKFVPSEMMTRIAACGENGYVRGPLGFGTKAELLAVLLPSQLHDSPMAVGFAFEASETVNYESLLQCLNEAVSKCLNGADAGADNVQQLPNAA